jgi:hypothetical protein
LRDTRINEEQSGTSRVFGVTQKGEACKVCIRLGDFCHHHKGQRSRNVTSRRENLSASRIHDEERSRTSCIFGYTHIGLPCKICIKRNDYCHYHELQRPRCRNATSASESLREDRATEGSHHPYRTFGITQSGRPCKVCVQQGDFCHFHEWQRYSNVVLQRDRSKKAREEQTRRPIAFGVTKKGDPCRHCIRLGDYCHRHESQRKSAECKECTICLETIQVDHVLDVLPCGHEFHRNCFGEWRKYGGSCPLCRQ